ncbi:MAG: redoxin domain-containing protein [bacterium]
MILLILFYVNTYSYVSFGKEDSTLPKLPATIFCDFQGNKYDLKENKSPFALLIVYSPQSCASCFRERILWERIANKFTPDTLQIIGITYGVDKKEIESFSKRSKFDFLVLWDSIAILKDSLKLLNRPYKILIDKTQNIIDIEISISSADAMENYFKKLCVFIQKEVENSVEKR